MVGVETWRGRVPRGLLGMPLAMQLIKNGTTRMKLRESVLNVICEKGGQKESLTKNSKITVKTYKESSQATQDIGKFANLYRRKI